MINPCKKCSAKPVSFIHHSGNQWSWTIHCHHCQNLVVITKQEFLESVKGKGIDTLNSTYNMLFDYELKIFKKLTENKWNKNNPKTKEKK